MRSADGWEEVVHRSDDEDADIMSAVTAIRQTEAQLQTQLANQIAANAAEVTHLTLHDNPCEVLMLH